MIKDTAMRMHFDSHPEEKVIGNALDEGFDVDYGSEYNNNNIELSYYFLRAKEYFKERFGLDQEILAVYDSHQVPDARIFSGVAELLNRYKMRLDPAIVLIILSGPREEIEPILNRNKEISFVVIDKSTLIDQRNRSPFFLRRELSKVLGSIDLFGLSSPLTTDNYLFGREQVISQIIGKIVSQDQNAGVFGLRKTGKTSVLFAIQRRFHALEILTVYLDCQTHYPKRWWRLLENIAYKISTELTTQKQIDLPSEIITDYSEENCQQKFESVIFYVRRCYKKLVILFDEIEWITPDICGLLAKHWDYDFVPFWRTMRGLHQETKSFLCFIVAGVNPYLVEKPYFLENIQNPIYQFLQPDYLSPLDAPHIRSMVRQIGKYMGMKFDEDVYSYLTNEFGGHSFLIRLACSVLYQLSKGRITDSSVKFGINAFTAISAPIKERLKSPCMDIVSSLIWWYPDEYEVLRVTCEGDLDFTRQYIQGDSRGSYHVISYGLLDKDSYDINIRVIKEYIKEYGDEWQTITSPFKRSGFSEAELPPEADLGILSEAYCKIGELEQMLRRVILIYLGAKVGHNKVQLAKIMAQCLAQEKGELFIGREAKDAINELFLNDLGTIISKNWNAFAPLFDNNKTRFDMNIEWLNRFRNKDAHFKPELDMADFNNCYSWLKEYLTRVE